MNRMAGCLRRAPHSTRLFLALSLVAFAASAGCRQATELPYSDFKAHIAAGDIAEVRFSAARLEATPTDAARAHGAPVLWRTEPVAADTSLVPLLDANHVRYRSDDSAWPGILGAVLLVVAGAAMIG